LLKNGIAPLRVPNRRNESAKPTLNDYKALLIFLSIKMTLIVMLIDRLLTYSVFSGSNRIAAQRRLSRQPFQKIPDRAKIYGYEIRRASGFV